MSVLFIFIKGIAFPEQGQLNWGHFLYREL